MLALHLLQAALALLAALAVGTVVHELLHATVLRAAGVDFGLYLLPQGEERRHGAGLSGGLAAVRLEGVPEGTSPWTIRTASLSPLLLAVPLALVPLGVLPDPFASGHVVGQAIALGTLACALPSPADFSLVWDADAVVRGETRVPVATAD